MLQKLKIVHNECVQVSANVFKMCDTMFTITHFFLIYVYIYIYGESFIMHLERKLWE